MAEYAEIINGEVTNLLVIDDLWTEEQAQEFLTKVSTNQWVKTEEKVGLGFEYHTEGKKFTRKKPFNSWILNKKTYEYEPPEPLPKETPKGYYYDWDEKLLKWNLEKRRDIINE